MKPSGNLEIFQAFGWGLKAITMSIKAGYFTGKANVIQITPMTGTMCQFVKVAYLNIGYIINQ